MLIILGPTASGKTKLAVELAQMLDAEIISADSRQVYRHMDIGTGKDLNEYADIPYYLIDILDPGEQYNVSRFLTDFEQAFTAIKAKGKRVIVCGGTGFYIQALLDEKPYTQVPIDPQFRAQFEGYGKEYCKSVLADAVLPLGFKVDFSSRKRMIRALEISRWLQANPMAELQVLPTYSATVIGLQPPLALRRQRISDRLKNRLDQGMLAEVERLHANGLSFEELEYYGLEYKYMAYYLQRRLSYTDFVAKLETEIHRYAKRQMTYFRKMEKDGIRIHWF